MVVGSPDGATDGSELGELDSATDGVLDGATDGLSLGASDGASDGVLDGASVGASVNLHSCAICGDSHPSTQ